MQKSPALHESQSETETIARRFALTRHQTEQITAHLEIEDLVIQSMPDVSPAKWHLGHTTWFFDEFILAPFTKSYKPFLVQSSRIYNSYYETVGDRVPRQSRGHLSRPTVKEVMRYRHSVTEGILELIHNIDHDHDDLRREILNRIEIGIHHEQQHQELLYTDLKFNLFQNINAPAYLPGDLVRNDPLSSSEISWVDYSGGLTDIGAREGFFYDNEAPLHKVFLQDFRLAQRLITNGEYLEFINASGYDDFRHWLSDGWDKVQANQWKHPLYWENRDGQWFEYTLSGWHPIELDFPVTHVSFYEASAYASWSGQRLPTEFELEFAAKQIISDEGITGNFLDSGLLHPTAAIARNSSKRPSQLFGDVWEWTSSAYLPYPGFTPLSGALGEYNGKFMNNQRVLRGGSCVTSQSHIRHTYRNFFQGDKKWQFTGIRLAS